MFDKKNCPKFYLIFDSNVIFDKESDINHNFLSLKCKKIFDNENRSQQNRRMNNCHCARVLFEQIVEQARNRNCSYERVAKDLNAGETCTACREDMKTYCESAACSRSHSISSQLRLQGAL